jgi:threonine dehydrogenase-like Zn-dependent dehydrogenase
MSLTKERQRPTLLGTAFEAAYNAGAILGHEFCGLVVAAGAEVRHTIGERYSPMFFHGCGRCASCLTGTPQGCAAANWFMGGYAHSRSSDRISRSNCLLNSPLMTAH